jgi:hypothetical protein
MSISRYRYLVGPLAVGTGAGLASGLLYSLMSQGTMLAAALACLAPLPIMIAMLGFGRLVGIVSLVTAFLAVAALIPYFGPHIDGSSVVDTTSRAALSFAFMLGAPALWLSYLAAMSRPRGQSQWQATVPSAASYSREYVPVERMVTASVAIAATVVVLGVIVIVLRHGSLDLAVDRIASELAPILEDMIGTSVRLPAGYDARSMARMLVLASAPVAAGMLFLVLVLNLWLAGRVTQLSGRLQRPWPDIAQELQIPRPYGLLLGVAFATTFLGGPPALIASIVGTVLAAAFALQGLAVAHVVSRRWKARMLVLWLMYGVVMLLMPSSLALLAVLGLFESLYSIRSRTAATPPKL